MTETTRYTSHKLIGSGAMADVFVAMDTKLERQVALKKIHAHLLKKPGLQERFTKEARTLASLSHKNIVAIYDVVDEKTPFLVMEYIQGKNLEDILSEGTKIRGLVLLEITRQLLGGLEYAHSKNIIHRDIKPSNIMVTESGHIKLMDFGIAHVFQGEALTMTGQFLGTPQFSSPEIIKGEKLTPKADVFSLCCLMYKCITGHSPFEGSSTHEMLQNVCNIEPSPISKYPGLSLSFIQELLHKGLEKDPHKRISASDMYVEIESFQKMLDLPSGRNQIADWLTDPVLSEKNESLDLYKRFGELAESEEKSGNKIKFHKHKHEQNKFSTGPHASGLDDSEFGHPLKRANRSNQSVKYLSLVMLVCLLLYLGIFFLSKTDKVNSEQSEPGLAQLPEQDKQFDTVNAGGDSTLVSASILTVDTGGTSSIPERTIPRKKVPE